jgi:hypothetical protein
LTSSSLAETRFEDTPVLIRRKHPPSRLEIPFYDEELNVAQGVPHGRTTGPVHSAMIRYELRVAFSLTVDNGLWGLDLETGKQKLYYPDFALVALPLSELDEALLTDARLAVEIVSTDKPTKEKNDTVLKKGLYARHQIPEFLLFYPDSRDPRILTWYTLTDSGYEEIKPDESGCYHSQAIEGMRIEPLPREEWWAGRKVRFFYEDLELEEAEEEWAAKERERAAKERERAAKEEALMLVDQERAEKERERAEKERLLLLLKKAGIDP